MWNFCLVQDGEEDRGEATPHRLLCSLNAARSKNLPLEQYTVLTDKFPITGGVQAVLGDAFKTQLRRDELPVDVERVSRQGATAKCEKHPE